MDRIFDPTRKRYVALTPEEKVRQTFVKFLLSKKYPLEAIKTEVFLDFEGQKRRADIVVFHKQKPLMIVECKSTKINISKSTFEQVWQYFYSLGAKYLVLTNIDKTFICKIEHKKCIFLKDFPSFEQLKLDL